MTDGLLNMQGRAVESLSRIVFHWLASIIEVCTKLLNTRSDKEKQQWQANWWEQ
jgi:hypothetical protein